MDCRSSPSASAVQAPHSSSKKTYVFFFQAEDGIRDYKVTGVQTCALPIWECRVASAALYARVRFSFYPCTRDRGCSVHPALDRKSTRLNSSHLVISYA